MIQIENETKPWAGALGLLRFSSAYAMMVLLLVLNITTIPGMLSGMVKIASLLMGVYYWSIYRPTLLPAWLIFIAAIILDALTMMPIGLSALILIGTQKFIVRQRRYLMGQSFMILWIGFAMLYAASLAMTAGVYMMMGTPIVITQAWLLSAAVTILGFPLITWLLHWTHKMLPAPEKQKSINLHNKPRHAP